MTATKQSIKLDYIARLKAAYPFYTDGSRALRMAEDAADAALAGRMKLVGECWRETLMAHGLPKRMPMKALAALPE